MEVMEDATSPMQKSLDDLSAAWRTQSLITAFEFDLFNVVARGPCTAEQVAQGIGASVKGTRRLLDVLAAMNYLTKGEQKYELCPEFRELPLLAKGQFRGYIQLVRDSWELWARLPAAVKSGQPMVNAENRNVTEEIFRRTAESLFLLHYKCARAVAAQLRHRLENRSCRILDLGAGSAVWSIPFAQTLSDCHVTAIDLPGVLPVTRSITRRVGVHSRYEYIAGDLSAINLEPDAYDLVILGHVLHVIGENISRSLLPKVFLALREPGLLLLCESSPNEDRTGPLFDLLFSLSLLLCTTDGQSFTVGEYRDWLMEAGFSSIETGLTASSSLILAVKESREAQQAMKEEGTSVWLNG
jgi:ubiquinone/menaquinone biosynthesis C-methylase UbiE